uniref:Uncharacterized protein n=1 Tax=Cyprinus carpio TaxID=7962 RepID=A0A8C1YA92_CYPCA
PSKMAIFKILVIMGTLFGPHEQNTFSTYDPQYCYILDGILLLYCILITAFFVRERVRVYNKQTNTHTRTLRAGCDLHVCVLQGRKRGDDSTYTRHLRHFIWFDVFNVFVFQGLSSMTKDTYDSLNMQPIHPPPR